MSVSCCVSKHPFLATCLVTIADVATCHELVSWCVGDMTLIRVTDNGVHRWHASFLLALHMSCRGISLTCDQDWLPVTDRRHWRCCQKYNYGTCRDDILPKCWQHFQLRKFGWVLDLNAVNAFAKFHSQILTRGRSTIQQMRELQYYVLDQYFSTFKHNF